MNQVKRHTPPPYSEAQATKWLSWMARNMQKHDQTVFLIEQLQVSWFSKKPERAAHFFLSLTVEALIFGLIAALIALMVARDTMTALITGMVAGNGGVIVGLLFSIGRRTNTIEMTGRLSWSWSYFRKNLKKSFKTGALRGVMAGLILGLVLSFLPSLRAEGLLIKGSGWKILLLDALATGLVSALIGGLIGSTSMGLKNKVPELTTKPNEGIKRSLATGLKRGLGWGVIAWVVGGLFFGLVLGRENWFFSGMVLGLTVGLPMGAFRGFMAGTRHYTLRLLLWMLGYAPRDYAAFLDYVVDDLRFMQRVGGGYIFIHRMLLEHFAAMETEDAATPPAAPERLRPSFGN